MEKLDNWINAHKPDMLEIFKYLHAHPELGFHEIDTAAFLAGELCKAGFEVEEGLGGSTGVMGTLRGHEPGGVLCLRSDMDALPMKETTGLPYASVNDGVCHACGHDANMTMTLFAAKAIAAAGLRAGTLKVLFQPAEELLYGSKTILGTSVLADVQEMTGVHLRPSAEARFGQATPALCHGSTWFAVLKVHGKATHGARPHLGVSALDMGVAIVNAAYAVHATPATAHSLTATKFITNGTARNIVPEEVELCFDLRAANNSVMEEQFNRFKNVAESICSGMGGTVEMEVIKCPAAEHNDAVVEDMRKAIVEVLGQSMPALYTTGGEDFHFYSTEAKIRTAYLGIGADLTTGLHQPGLTFNTDVLPLGARILAHFVANKQGTCI